MLDISLHKHKISKWQQTLAIYTEIQKGAGEGKGGERTRLGCIRQVQWRIKICLARLKILKARQKKNRNDKQPKEKRICTSKESKRG
mmetsp:Transcript_26216/g.66659  ORF Transcript_26216/g.66659 Transcript_26216/m.66659 type:complete len:87 (+) Transcript_26216:372-632(+)